MEAEPTGKAPRLLRAGAQFASPADTCLPRSRASRVRRGLPEEAGQVVQLSNQAVWPVAGRLDDWTDLQETRMEYGCVRTGSREHPRHAEQAVPGAAAAPATRNVFTTPEEATPNAHRL